MAQRNTSKDKDISIQLQETIRKQGSNYNKELYKLIRPYVGKSILDVGCSIGNITHYYIRKDRRIVGVDVVPESVRIIKKNFSKYKNFKAYRMDASDKKILGLKSNRFDTIVCLNVLEHIKDDSKTIDNFYNVLEDDGKLLLIVPAMQFLYGSMDKTDHHFRRYNKRELKRKLQEKNFKIIKMRYFNFAGIFGWYLNGRIFKNERVDQSMFKFYNKMVPSLFAIERYIPLPMGLSVLCICEKKGTTR